MTQDPTRRQVIRGTAGALAVGGGASVAGADETTADAVVNVDRETAYPRCVYQPADDGEWEVALPISIHARAPGDTTALSAVTNAFTGLSNLRWTRVLPDAKARAWDRDAGKLVAPDRSFRRPRVGDEWAHVHVWGVDGNRAAIHAHLDVLDFTASHLHRGDRYADATRAIAAQLRDHGWAERAPYGIDYGVDDDRLERWGETDEVMVEYERS